MAPIAGAQTKPALLPAHVAPCGCCVFDLPWGDEWRFCPQHSIAHDCAQAFQQAAPAAYATWLRDTERALAEKRQMRKGV